MILNGLIFEAAKKDRNSPIIEAINVPISAIIMVSKRAKKTGP